MGDSTETVESFAAKSLLSGLTGVVVGAGPSSVTVLSVADCIADPTELSLKVPVPSTTVSV